MVRAEGPVSNRHGLQGRPPVRSVSEDRLSGREGEQEKVVPAAGLEPAREILPTDFKSGASTNSATPACVSTSH